jgi:hypothetical protein
VSGVGVVVVQGDPDGWAIESDGQTIARFSKKRDATSFANSMNSVYPPPPLQAGDVGGMREAVERLTSAANEFDWREGDTVVVNALDLRAILALSGALTPSIADDERGERAPDTPWAAYRKATLAAPDDQRVKELEAQIEWRSDAPPRSAEPIYGHTWSPYRWQAYKPSSEQFRRGIKGRWQAMNEHGGWDNAKAPDEWATVEQINARRALLDTKRGEGA